MILLLPLLAQAATCPADIKADPARAVETATRWAASGGGALARQCLGLAFAAQEKWPEAARSFEQGARDAERAGNKAAALLWVQAANARLAGGEPRPAIAALDAALVSGALTGPVKGEARLDRARANVAAGDLPAARADLDEALKLVPDDPLAWLLSAALARRMGVIERAQADIAEAMRRAPDDASVALEAGRIALAAGLAPAARVAWEGAVRAQPDSEAAKLALAELGRLGPTDQISEPPSSLGPGLRRDDK